MNARWTTLLTDAMIGERIASGEWDGSTLAGHLERLWSADPGRVLVIDGDRSLSVADCREMALRLLSALQQRGLVPGDVVSFQLPNWHEAIIIELACVYGGLVCNPIVQIYRDAEVQHIVADARSRVLFVPQSFRRFDYERIYMRDASLEQSASVVRVLQALVEHHGAHPAALPRPSADDGLEPHGKDALREAVTYVGGMTDRYAFDQAVQLLGWRAADLPVGIY